MANIKKELEKVYDECTKLYEQGGVSAVIDHVNVQFKTNPMYKNVQYKHCTQCNAEQPTLNNICLVCGSGVHAEIGRKILTIGEVKELLSDLNDDDIAVLEACDANGDVEDLYPMYIDVIEGIELLNGKTVNEVRFCQMPNTKPEEKKPEFVVTVPDTEKIEKFADEMSETLYIMRAESDLHGSFLQTPNTDVSIPDEFIDKIVDDPEHSEKMKSLIKNAIVNYLTECPNNYKNENGEYHYSGDVYDFSYVVDKYIEQLYEDLYCTKTVLVCSECGSDNVRTKMWVNANTQDVIDSAGDDSCDDSWCNDCQGHNDLSSETMMPRKKVIGFQVNSIDGTGHADMHPKMEASFCIYSLSQAREMLKDKEGGINYNELITIWTDDIEEPTFMFEGDPRD